MILKASRISVGPRTARLWPFYVLILSPMSFSCATPATVRGLLSDVPRGGNGGHPPKGVPVVRLVLKERLLSALEVILRGIVGILRIPEDGTNLAETKFFRISRKLIYFSVMNRSKRLLRAQARVDRLVHCEFSRDARQIFLRLRTGQIGFPRWLRCRASCPE